MESLWWGSTHSFSHFTKSSYNFCGHCIAVKNSKWTGWYHLFFLGISFKERQVIYACSWAGSFHILKKWKIWNGYSFMLITMSGRSISISNLGEAVGHRLKVIVFSSHSLTLTLYSIKCLWFVYLSILILLLRLLNHFSLIFVSILYVLHRQRVYKQKSSVSYICVYII